MKLNKRGKYYNYGDSFKGIQFAVFQLRSLGFCVYDKKSVEIVLKEFCLIKNNVICRKDNSDCFFKCSTYEIINNRHYYR